MTRPEAIRVVNLTLHQSNVQQSQISTAEYNDLVKRGMQDGPGAIMAELANINRQRISFMQIAGSAITPSRAMILGLVLLAMCSSECGSAKATSGSTQKDVAADVRSVLPD
jgi:hypothetical protein